MWGGNGSVHWKCPAGTGEMGGADGTIALVRSSGIFCVMCGLVRADIAVEVAVTLQQHADKGSGMGRISNITQTIMAASSPST